MGNHAWCLLLLVTFMACSTLMLPACSLMPLSSSVVASMALFAPLLDGLNAHLSILHGDVRWCFPAATWGQMKLGHLSADGVRGGNIAPSFDGASGGISR
jgi:hypothetical protein